MEKYDWYKKLDSGNISLEQGDLIKSCPIVLPPNQLEGLEEYEFEIIDYDVIIMSQSCDLEQEKVKNVLVSPYTTFNNYLEAIPQNQRDKNGNVSKKRKERDFDDFRKGLKPNYHLINKDIEKGIEDFLLVDFRNVYGVHIDFLKEHIKTLENRVRLLPPYREHLAQAFARFFMRVGLPQNIPQYK